MNVFIVEEVDHIPVDDHRAPGCYLVMVSWDMYRDSKDFDVQVLET
jgi:hypothetical protein